MPTVISSTPDSGKFRPSHIKCKFALSPFFYTTVTDAALTPPLSLFISLLYPKWLTLREPSRPRTSLVSSTYACPYLDNASSQDL